MKIKCPSCSATGRIPNDKIPATGANIRCPACSFVFFVGGPHRLNVDEGENQQSRLPEARRTETLPSDITEQVRRLAAEREASSSQAEDAPSPDETSENTLPSSSEFGSANPGQSGLGSANPGQSGLGSASPGQSGLGSASPGQSGLGSASPGQSGLGSEAAEEPNLLGDDLGLEPVEEAPAAPAPAPPHSLGPTFWKIRTDGGMIYEFADTEPAQRWLTGRGTFEDLEASRDGATWEPISAIPEFNDVRPQGLRSRTTTGSMRAVPVQEDVEAVREREEEESRSRRATSSTESTRTVGRTEKNRATGSRTSKAAEKFDAQLAASSVKLRQALLMVLLALTAGIAYVYYNTPEEEGLGLVMPDSPAGRTMDWVLAAINGNSEALTAAEVEALMAPSFLEVVRAQEVVELLQSLDQGPGQVRANRFDGRRTETTLSVVLTTSQMHQGRISVRTESDPPHRIESILITPLR